MKMNNNLHAKYYQKKQRKATEKRLVKCIKIFLKKKIPENMVENDTKIFQKMKNKGSLCIGKTF